MIIGNVTRDPELRTTGGGQSVCSFSIATNMRWTDNQGQQQERAEYHNIVAWRKLAEICSQYLAKGRKVYVEGRLQTREWEGQDGQKRSRTEIVADNMIILDKKGAGGASPMPSGSTTPSPEKDESVGDQEIRLEDIPF
jgi:single-strand DNA-binding protein